METKTQTSNWSKTFPKIEDCSTRQPYYGFWGRRWIEEFDDRLNGILNHFAKYNRLDENAIEQVLSSESKDYETPASGDKVLLHGINGRIIKAQTANQRKLVDMMGKNDMVFAVGPAGTGKTYTGVALAVKALKEKQVRRIILTRLVEAGENLGFAGDLKEKN